MEESSKPTSTRRNVLKKGAIATTLVGGVAAVSGSAAAAGDAYLTVSGEGMYAVKVLADDVSVSSEGVNTDVSRDGEYYHIEGRVDGSSPITGDTAFVTIEGYEQLIDTGFSSGVDLELDGDVLAEATGPAAEGDLDSAVSVTGEGEYSLEIDADEVYVSSEGVFTDVTFQNGFWVVEGRVDGGPINGDHAFIEIYGGEGVISADSESDVTVK